MTTSFNITMRDLEKIGSVLAAIARNGVEIDTLTFKSSKAAEAEESSRALAVSHANERAIDMAKAAHVELGSLLQMRDGVGFDPETMENYPDTGGDADLVALPFTSVAPRDIVITNAV